jgi:hypothetical protein
MVDRICASQHQRGAGLSNRWFRRARLSGIVSSRFWCLVPLAGAAIGIVATAGAATAEAAPDQVPPELARFVAQPANREAVLALINDQAMRLPGECRAWSFSENQIAVSIMPHFNASGVPLHGQWKESWKASGCGKTRIFNVEIFTRDNGAVSRLQLMPGTTQAPAGLQSDAMLHAVTAANTPSGGCQERTVIDTAFVGYDGPAPAANAPAGNATGRALRPWHEDWTVNACGTLSVVVLHFLPDPNPSGIRITADARPAK